MSIFATQWHAEIQNRDMYGTVIPDAPPEHLFVCTSGMSTILRLSVDNVTNGTVSYITPDEARQLAAALLSAADHTDASNAEG